MTRTEQFKTNEFNPTLAEEQRVYRDILTLDYAWTAHIHIQGRVTSEMITDAAVEVNANTGREFKTLERDGVMSITRISKGDRDETP